MKFGLPLLFTVLSVSFANGATLNQYINSGNLVSPPGPAPVIDAVTFINEGYFEVNDFGPSPLPYQTANTLHFQNTASGIILGHPGYFFQHISGNTRGPMTTWENRGAISSFGNVSNIFLSPTAANWLLVDSDSIVSSGSLNVSASGLLRLTGNTVNVARSRLRAGSPLQNTFFSSAFWLYETNYNNDAGISDVYWGGGTNNTMGGGGSEMVLNFTAPGSAPNFNLANIRSAFHSVALRSLFTGTLITNTANYVPSFPKGVISSTYTNVLGNEMWVQTVFVATNFFDANLKPEITFVTNFFGGPSTVQVGFHSVERDIALDLDITNSLFVIDGLAGRTNVTLARNLLVPANRRPDSYAVSRGPLSFFTAPGNASYTNFPAFAPTYGTNVVPVTYAAYSADLAVQNLTGTDPTNMPGRIELTGQNVNLRDSRFRAESLVSITANNLLNTNLARVSAPFMNFDLGTTQPQLLISNLAPLTVNRLYGNVAAWSAVWDNTDSRFPGMNIHFHVLIVDHTLQTTLPTTVNRFLARAPRIVMQDFLSVNQRLRLETPILQVRTSGGLSFPPGWSWGSSNMVNVVNVINNGFLSVPGAAVLGTDRGSAYTNLVNRGTFSAQSFSILGDYFENTGSIIAQGANFRFDGRKACLLGTPIAQTTNFFSTNLVFTGGASISARGNITINANSLIFSNALLQAGSSIPGAIIMTPGVRLTDSGPLNTNYWNTTGGIRVMKKPTGLGDLMGTYITVTAPPGTEIQNIWDGKGEVGATVMGYSNNLAVGKLTLDGTGEESVIRFSGLPGKKNGIYVDYLELLNNATNFDKPDPSQLGLVIDPSMTIYFAHANLDAAKLDGKQNGRIKWVKGFAGPLSTTNIIYPSGEVVSMNISLARHKDYDSDGDGTPNINDPTPLFSAVNLRLAIAKDRAQPNRVLLSWQTLANAINYIEYKPSVTSTGAWQLLRSTTAPVNMRMSLSEPATGGGRAQRFYRVRVDVPPQ